MSIKTINTLKAFNLLPSDINNIIDKYSEYDVLRLSNVETYMMKNCWWSPFAKKIPPKYTVQLLTTPTFHTKTEYHPYQLNSPFSF